MISKYITIILLGLFCSAVAEVKEEEIQQWFDDVLEKYYDDCKDYISDESLQELKDDYQADNEEIRDFRLCMAVKQEFIKMSKIDVVAIFENMIKYTPNINEEEKDIAENLLSNCKEEGEDESGDKNIIGKFTGCLIDRCKSNY